MGGREEVRRGAACKPRHYPLLPVLAKPSMARAGARIVQSGLKLRLTAQGRGSVTVRRRQAAEAHIGMRSNLARLPPLRLLSARFLFTRLLSACFFAPHRLPPRLLPR